MRTMGNTPVAKLKERSWLGAVMAACLVFSGLAAAQDLKAELEAAGNGATVVMTDKEYDLDGQVVTVNGKNVTLKGSAAYDMGEELMDAVIAGAADFQDMDDFTKSALDKALRNAVDDIQKKIPTTNIYNSAAKDGIHGGIQAPNGGFSLMNMTMMGTKAIIDNTTGASMAYMGLLGSTFSRTSTPGDGQGMGLIENVAFIDNIVDTSSPNNIAGVGGAVNNVGNVLFFTQRRYDPVTGAYVGAAGDRIETLDGIVSSVFIGNEMRANMNASVGNRDLGSAAGWVDLRKVEYSLFADNFTEGHHAFGGALYAYNIGDITASVFYNNTVASDHDGYGGAISTASIESITDSIFVGNEAQGLEYGLGRTAGALGGAINATGVATLTTGEKGIGAIEDSLFAYNRAYNETGEEAVGGAINVGRKLGEITDVVFYGNTAEATNGGDAAGGAINYTLNFANGEEASKATTITDSHFIGNTVKAGGEGSGGAMNITVAATRGGASATTHTQVDYTLNLAATAGGMTVFSGNTVNGEANSFYVGYADTADLMGADVVFNVDAAAKGAVAILDPLLIDLVNDPLNGNTASKTFSLNNKGAGTFIWDGINELNASHGSFVNLEDGSTTVFMNGFHLHSHGHDITVNLDNGARVDLGLYDRNVLMPLFEDATLQNTTGASIGVSGYYSFTDEKETWLLADGGNAGAVATAGIDTYAPNADSTFTLSTDGTFLYGTLDYKADNAGFDKSSRNAWRSKPAMQEVVDSLAGDEQAALFDSMSKNPENYVPSAHLNFAHFGLSANRVTTQQALRANDRSRAGNMRFADSGAVASDRALASSAYDLECVGGKFRVWAEYIGARIDQDSKKGYSGYDGDLDGGVLGLSYDFSSAFTMGAYFSYSDGSADYDTVSADFDSDVFQGGVFAQYRSACSGWRATLDLAYTHLDNDSTRFTDAAYKASFDQGVFSAGLEVGYEFNPWCNGRLTPYAGVRYQHLHQDSIRETGAGLTAIHMGSLNADSFASSLGISLAHDFVGESASFTPTLYAAWRHEFGDTNVSSTFRYAGFNTITRVDSLDQKRDALEIGAALSATLVRKENFAFGVNGGYNALISSDRIEHNFYAGVEFRF